VPLRQWSKTQEVSRPLIYVIHVERITLSELLNNVIAGPTPSTFSFSLRPVLMSPCRAAWA